ncbi:MAG: zinc ABC transporter substrate-binding protein [Alphaproteobacteria bacterium]|nr:zinc ABC transporter substrate-binding protein [Alphaproteobacteria bacterium]MBF0251027.1 zinc ABC transporter substrate-binding protein [Alphaproteobacteria bacterium]
MLLRIPLAALGALLSTALSLSPYPAEAGDLSVVASIKPLQALVRGVMGETGEPKLLVPATASPHTFTLKPSQAQELSRADVVFWVGPTLETALTGPMETLVARGRATEMLGLEGLDLLHVAEDEDRDDHDDHHDHGGIDPHVWLSPNNAKVMARAIAARLGAVDPGNAQTYARNCEDLIAAIDAAVQDADAVLADGRETAYLVHHDGFGYLARDFHLTQAGFLQTMPGREPGAKHLSDIKKRIQSMDIKCLFVEPQFTPSLARQLSEDTGVRIAGIDALGVDIRMSATAYPDLIRALARQMQGCLSGR